VGALPARCCLQPGLGAALGAGGRPAADAACAAARGHAVAAAWARTRPGLVGDAATAASASRPTHARAGLAHAAAGAGPSGGDGVAGQAHAANVARPRDPHAVAGPASAASSTGTCGGHAVAEQPHAATLIEESCSGYTVAGHAFAAAASSNGGYSVAGPCFATSSKGSFGGHAVAEPAYAATTNTESCRVHAVAGHAFAAGASSGGGDPVAGPAPAASSAGSSSGHAVAEPAHAATTIVESCRGYTVAGPALAASSTGAHCEYSVAELRARTSKRCPDGDTPVAANLISSSTWNSHACADRVSRDRSPAAVPGAAIGCSRAAVPECRMDRQPQLRGRTGCGLRLPWRPRRRCSPRRPCRPRPTGPRSGGLRGPPRRRRPWRRRSWPSAGPRTSSCETGLPSWSLRSTAGPSAIDSAPTPFMDATLRSALSTRRGSAIARWTLFIAGGSWRRTCLSLHGSPGSARARSLPRAM
ncbi:unnamed protein product, partial [Prorocentrum cordatum]